MKFQEPDYSKTPDWANPGQNNIVEEPRWWEAQNIPWQLVKELRRRSNTNNIGQSGTTDVSFDFKNQYEKYRGPMTPWVRAFSNGTGVTVSGAVPKSRYLEKYNYPQVYQGFLLKGGDNFYDAYGLTPKGDGTVGQKEAIIGWDARGIPHSLNSSLRSQYNYNANNPPKQANGDDLSDKNQATYPQNSVVPSILPCPGIESVNIKTNKDMMADATINWKCYSLAQLEYMMPFWLTPKINVFLEFGWNLFDTDSLLALNSIDLCYLYIRYPQLALQNYYRSFGNYGLVTGIIKDFNFSTDDGFVYNCSTKIISRQAMYAGFRVDNPTEGVNTETQYATVKDFFVNYLQFARDVIKTDGKSGNYINYIVDNFTEIKKVIDKQNSSKDKKAQAQAEVAQNLQPKTDTKTPSNSNFYGGQKENRMFMGRIESIYGAAKLPVPGPSAGQLDAQRNMANLGGLGGGIGNPNTLPASAYAPPASSAKSINYGKTSKGLDVVSYGDKDTDFDYNDAGNDEVWFQLDFVFDIINFFCSTPYSKNNYIDIKDIVISAHPNLISCDKNVLIPNPVAPKVNSGMVGSKSKNQVGYLTPEQADEETNNFYHQPAWKSFDAQVKAGSIAEKEYFQQVKAWQAGPSANAKPTISGAARAPYWKAARKCRKTFGTDFHSRDDLDAIINWLYYNKGQPKPKEGDAAFPFKTPQPINNKVYTDGYFGKLKNLYISKSKLMEIGKDGEIKTLQQLVNKILNVVNESVDNFWKLEVVNNPIGGLGIIDKNIDLKTKEIYMFDLGSTSNVVKKVSFNVALTNDQTNQILYGAGQNGNPYAQQTDEIQKAANDTSKSNLERINKITQIQNGLPAIAFMDRFDSLEVKKQAEETIRNLKKDDKDNPYPPKIDSVDENAPHGPLEDINNAISKLQTGKPPEDVLTMRVRFIKAENEVFAPIKMDENKKVRSAELDYVFLNLPSTMKDRLRQMLDDGDLANNTAKYLGPVDNFTITLTLDGIMGLRMFQHFAIDNLPKPYVPGNVIFMITEVEHQLDKGKWETVVNAILKGTPDQEYKFIRV